VQQDTAKMQGVKELSEVRGFPFGADRSDIHNVEDLIIDKYLGIPYRHKGRAMDGLDCWGFLKLVYSDLGFRLFDIEDLEYSRIWGIGNKDYFKDNHANDWEKVNAPEILDGVLFLSSRGIANHAGIVLKNRRFIHCCRAGVIVSRLDDESWKKKTEGFYTLRALSGLRNKA
jgi:cell wall-associated NlpC family hydrolase